MGTGYVPRLRLYCTTEFFPFAPAPISLKGKKKTFCFLFAFFIFILFFSPFARALIISERIFQDTLLFFFSLFLLISCVLIFSQNFSVFFPPSKSLLSTNAESLSFITEILFKNNIIHSCRSLLGPRFKNIQFPILIASLL